MSANLFTSVKKICGSSDQAVIYGYADCKYIELGRLLSGKGSPLAKVFDYNVGASSRKVLTKEGRVIQPLQPGLGEFDVKRQCKAGLTNIVFENYKRKKEGLPLIPVLFATSSDFVSRPLSPSELTSRDNKKITPAEIRRAYKLCSMEGEIGEIAQATFKFVHVSKAADSPEEIGAVQEMAAPWERPDWKTSWAERNKTESPRKKEKNYVWKRELASQIHSYDLQMKRLETQYTKTAEILIRTEPDFTKLEKMAFAAKKAGLSAKTIQQFVTKALRKKDPQFFLSITDDAAFKVQKSKLKPLWIKYQLSRHGNG
jgi:hypothetical protein